MVVPSWTPTSSRNQDGLLLVLEQKIIRGRYGDPGGKRGGETRRVLNCFGFLR